MGRWEGRVGGERRYLEELNVYGEMGRKNRWRREIFKGGFVEHERGLNLVLEGLENFW